MERQIDFAHASGSRRSSSQNTIRIDDSPNTSKYGFRTLNNGHAAKRTKLDGPAPTHKIITVLPLNGNIVIESHVHRYPTPLPGQTGTMTATWRLAHVE